jgi:hypothetical protein
MTGRRRFIWWLPAALTLFPSSMALAQCAMCRASLLNSEGGAELIAGLRQGVVLLLAAPLVIAAVVLIGLRRARAEAASRSGATRLFQLPATAGNRSHNEGGSV